MKLKSWRWLGGMPRLLSAPRSEPAQQARRILAIQRNIVLPAKFVVIGVVVYYLFFSPWLGEAATTYGVLLDSVQKFFNIYIAFNIMVAVVLFVVRRFPPGFVQWIVFAVGLVDGLLLGGLTLLTGGFDSVLYWVFPGMIVLNALSIPLAMPQIVLNLALSGFFLGAGYVEMNVRGFDTTASNPAYRSARRLFLAGDIKDLPVFVARLKGHGDATSQFLWDRFSVAMREKLWAYNENSSDGRTLKQALANEINRIVLEGPVYEPSRFAGVTLSAEAQALLDQKLHGEQLIRLNRLLLENAYPSELVQSQGKNASAPRVILVPTPPVEPFESPAEPFILRIVVLWLFTACCYGVQVLAARQQVAEEEQKEFIARTEQLQAAGRLAAEFAHQIKNPLAIINNATFSLRRALKEGRSDVAEEIRIIQEEVERSDQIVTQIMGYAQLSEGRVEKLNVVEELDRAIEQAFPSAVDGKIKVQRNYAPDFPPLLMQRRHLSEIFVNLLQNAREVLGAGGEVSVTAVCRSDYSVEVTISDSGPGIPADRLEGVFEAYYTTKEKGTGLGLAIVKHNVELYAGSVRVESELGKGARFILTFPAKTMVQLTKPR